ncbi:MAG: hypothetical protein HY390_02015 [Deltaproteobacteria bacterium]|nr:hypothetical protein [Deltaproteobacteria bacterium]
MKYWVLLMVGVSFIKTSPGLACKDHLLQHESKAEKKLHQKEEKQATYLSQKKEEIEKKYEKQLQKLEKRKPHLAQKKYERTRSKIEKWRIHSFNKLDYQAQNMKERIARKRSQLSKHEN